MIPYALACMAVITAQQARPAEALDTFQMPADLSFVMTLVVAGCGLRCPSAPDPCDHLSPFAGRSNADNTRWLGELLSTRGWPGRTLVGEEGAGAAWRLAQHADRDPVRQWAFLHALRSAAGQGQASWADLAYLEDRVRVNTGQPQLYGTQLTVTDGEVGPCPIEDRQRLDERRAEAGLEPFADYEARMRDRS